MPVIPKYESNTVTQARGISADAATAPARALTGLGNTLSNIGGDLAEIDRKEIEFERTTKKLKLENSLREEFETYAGTFEQRTDYDKFIPEAEQQFEKIRSKYIDQIGDDRVLGMAFGNAVDRQSSEFRTMLRNKKFDILKKEGQAELQKKADLSLKDYAGTVDPDAREIIKGEIEISVLDAVDKGIIDPITGDKLISDWSQSAEKNRIDVMIDGMDNLEPENMGSYLKTIQKEIDQSDLMPADKTALREQAENVSITAKNQAIEYKNKVTKEAHDNEERQVGDDFIKGDYVSALRSVYNSQLLTGTEKKQWMKDIVDAQANPNPSGLEQAKDIIIINDMISKSEDPDKIRKQIITANLKKEDKEQYLNKLETDIKSEISEGRKSGYRLIQDLIIPKRGPEADLLETPLETNKVALAQMQLDMWIETEKKNNKTPTMTQIKAKAIELGQANQVGIAERIEYEREWAKKTASEIKYLKQKEEK
jgi:hypothetical protein